MGELDGVCVGVGGRGQLWELRDGGEWELHVCWCVCGREMPRAERDHARHTVHLVRFLVPRTFSLVRLRARQLSPNPPSGGPAKGERARSVLVSGRGVVPAPVGTAREGTGQAWTHTNCGNRWGERGSWGSWLTSPGPPRRFDSLLGEKKEEGRSLAARPAHTRAHPPRGTRESGTTDSQIVPTSPPPRSPSVTDRV